MNLLGTSSAGTSHLSTGSGLIVSGVICIVVGFAIMLVNYQRRVMFQDSEDRNLLETNFSSLFRLKMLNSSRSKALRYSIGTFFAIGALLVLGGSLVQLAT
jgi:hypothetical protein